MTDAQTSQPKECKRMHTQTTIQAAHGGLSTRHSFAQRGVPAGRHFFRPAQSERKFRGVAAVDSNSSDSLFRGGLL